MVVGVFTYSLERAATVLDLSRLYRIRQFRLILYLITLLQIYC